MKTVPLSMLLEQGPMIRTLARVLLLSARPSIRPSNNPTSFPVVKRSVAAPSRRLVRHYAAWCGAPPGRYSANLPPHLFSQFALPVFSVQLEMTRYPMLAVINQGCAVSIRRKIAMGTGLRLSASVAEIEEKDNRARVRQRLSVGTPSGGEAVSVDFHTTFILERSSSGRTPPPEPSAPLEPVASWNARGSDGLQFGLLTGDLNPIHWFGPIARRSPFKGKVMHGFGMFARSYEVLQNATGETIRFADVRFVRPARLPGRGLQILRGRSAGPDGSRPLELRDGGGAVLMAGRYLAK
jgi:hypothetical protein